MRDFFFLFLLPLAIPLCLSLSPERVPHLWALWWCFSAQNGFTSSKTSLLYLYFTTPPENHASWAAELWAERGRESKRGGGQVRKRERVGEREREEGMKEGENLREANNKQNGKEDRERQTGELREGRTKWSKVKVEDINRRVEKRKWGREADGERLSGHPEIGCDNMITLGAQR